jgi:hypothetical protein
MTKLKSLPKNKHVKTSKEKAAFVRSGNGYFRAEPNTSAEVIDIRSLMQAVDELINQNKLASRLNMYIKNDASALKQALHVFPEFGSGDFFIHFIRVFKCITVGKIDTNLPEPLQIALRECAHVFLQTACAPWQLVLLPVVYQGRFLTISCYIKDTDFLPPDEDGNQFLYKKFIIEFEYDHYDQIIIEGIYSQECLNKLQLMVKTGYPVSEAKENQIRELFKKESADGNICGGISFAKLTGNEENPFGLIAQHYCLSKIAPAGL